MFNFAQQENTRALDYWAYFCMLNDHISIVMPLGVPRTGSFLTEKMGKLGLKLMGWQLTGEFADVKKMIVIVAPHTSNWDWALGVFTQWAIRVRFSYFIKSSLFFWPLSFILRSTGGIPVDRNDPKGLLAETVKRFSDDGSLYLAITPEGTRKSVARWKTGFLRIASATEAPVVPVVLNRKLRKVEFCSPLHFSGDIEADLVTTMKFFQSYK